MHKTLTLMIAAMALAIGTSNPAMAQDKTDQKADQNTEQKTDDQTKADKGDKPAASPGWLIVEEEFWFPFQYSFADALHNARVHYRHGQEKAARDEIKQAMMWMKMAKGMTANKESEADLETAISDLRDLAMFLDKGELFKASKMEATFARAATALAKHHKFNADKAAAKNEMRIAGKHLMAAAHNIKAAARSANYEYGDEVVEIFDDYSPFGFYDETIVVEKNKLSQELNSIGSEIEKLEAKVEKIGK